MYVIKMNDDKTLITTIHATIYQREKNADTLVFLLPIAYEGKNMADCDILMRYILPNGSGRSEAIIMEPEPYNQDYYRYHLSVDTRLTEKPGEIELWLTAIDMYDNVVLKSSSIDIVITPAKEITDYMNDTDLNQLDMLNARVKTLEMQKADNIRFNKDDSTIQLTANDNPIGDRIHISIDNESDPGMGISNAEIISGELVITFSDGSVKNLGNVVGEDGAVYVPHMSENKILTFTIEDKADKIPDPVDLNPFDEWSGMDDSETVASFVWEKM